MMSSNARFFLKKTANLCSQYGNTGAGASGTRASFSQKLSSALTIADILGSTYKNWVDTTYLAAV